MKLVVEFDETYWSKEEISKMSDDVIRALPFIDEKGSGYIVHASKDRRTFRYLTDSLIIGLCFGIIGIDLIILIIDKIKAAF